MAWELCERVRRYCPFDDWRYLALYVLADIAPTPAGNGTLTTRRFAEAIRRQERQARNILTRLATEPYDAAGGAWPDPGMHTPITLWRCDGKRCPDHFRGRHWHYRLEYMPGEQNGSGNRPKREDAVIDIATRQRRKRA